MEGSECFAICRVGERIGVYERVGGKVIASQDDWQQAPLTDLFRHFAMDKGLMVYPQLGSRQKAKTAKTI